AVGDRRSALQVPVDGIRPRVVRADEALHAARRGVADARAAVAADVVGRANLPVLAAHEDHVLAGEVDREEVAGLRGLAGVPDHQPLPGEDPRVLELEDLGGEVVIAGATAVMRLAPLAEQDVGRSRHLSLNVYSCHAVSKLPPEV